MEINIQFTELEIRQFFEQNGFEVVAAEFGSWGPAYHNSDEWNGYKADAVVINGRYVKCTDLLKKVAEYRLKKLIVPVGGDIKTDIKTAFIQLLKSN